MCAQRRLQIHDLPSLRLPCSGVDNLKYDCSAADRVIMYKRISAAMLTFPDFLKDESATIEAVKLVRDSLHCACSCSFAIYKSPLTLKARRPRHIRSCFSC